MQAKLTQTVVPGAAIRWPAVVECSALAAGRPNLRKTFRRSFTMKTLNQINPVPAIPRSLSESPDYQPDWRHQTVQHYVDDIGKATDPSQKLVQIWKAEPDIFVLQSLLFHCGGPCLIRPHINYAVSCWQNRFKTGIAAKSRH